jgi:hypothetical protein
MNSRATLAKNFIFTLVWFVAGTAVARPQTPRFTKQSPHSFSGKGFVLLQNGNVLSGKIETNADRVSVQLDGNSTIKLEHKQIEIIGESIEALYQHQVKGIRQWGTGEHWHMAHWCIKQELLDKAIVHYQEIEKTAPSTPQFKQIEHMLREALLANKTVQESLGITPKVQPKSDAGSQLAGAESDANSGVVLASAQMPTSNDAPNLATSTKQSHENNAWTQQQIPGYVRKTFQSTVLPILVTRCGQSGCHGLLGKSDFHLYQPVGDQAASILANDLASVLRYIDRDRSENSELLAYATKAHGIQRNPSLNQAREDERVLIERINQWAKSLTLTQSVDSSMPNRYPGSEAAKKPSASTPEVTQAVATRAVSPVAETASRMELFKGIEKRDRDAKLSKGTKAGTPPVFLSGTELDDLEKAIQDLEQQYEGAESAKSIQKKDPFDPEVFNRKFR